MQQEPKAALGQLTIEVRRNRFNPTFMTFFLAQRLGVPVERTGASVAAIAGAGAIATMIGALGGGFLSDPCWSWWPAACSASARS